jgi:outer membrane protein OmpA-like peptidoglycan-associated protein
MKYLIPALLSTLIAFPVIAAGKEKSCPLNTNDDNKFCEHKEWREEATLADDSSVRTVSLPENSERPLLQHKVTLWSLPGDKTPLYKPADLKQVKIDVTSTHFSSAEATIELAKITQVNKLLEFLKDKEGLQLEIIGHTDSQQLSLKAQRWFENNQELSIARAKSVAEYLQKQLNLPQSSMIIRGKGSKEPIASNASPAGMAKKQTC